MHRSHKGKSPQSPDSVAAYHGGLSSLRPGFKSRPGRFYFFLVLITEGIFCKTCKELDIEIAVNPDHVHIFFKYPPKYSLSFIAKRLKGRTRRILRKEFPHLKEFCDEHLWAPSCYHGSVGNGWEVVEKYIQTQDKHNAKPTATGLVLKSGV